MAFSTAFKPDIAGKYSGLPGFSPGISLGESLTKPLNQQVGSASSPPSDLAAIYKSYGDIPEDLKKDLLRQEMFNRSSKTADSLADLKSIYEMANDPVRRQQILDQQLAFNTASMEKAFPYLMAREIPRQIAEGFSNQAALTLRGAQNVVDTMNDTMRARTPLSFASAPYQAQKYFS